MQQCKKSFAHKQPPRCPQWTPGVFQISTFLCFYERPGGFVDAILPQSVQKEKRQTRKPAALMRFMRSRTQLRLLYYNQCKKKSQRVNVLPLALCTHFSPKRVYSTSDTIDSISHIQHFINAFQPVAYRCPAVICPLCNVRQREPLNVPQKSYLSVNPPKRCALDSGGHLLSVKSLQRSGQHYTSRRHRQHRARRAAAAVRRCAPLR